jgi:sulfotransferase
VGVEARRTILPPDLFEQYADLNFWKDSRSSEAHVIRTSREAQGINGENA